ncbi:MAG TPA: DUF3737 family protein [Bacilli bacterium]|nr:DUF3737 family protein [Bacilli bacterium]
MSKIIKDQIFQEERALYNLQDAELINCRFDGPLDGESSLKETNHIIIRDSYFNLRYPLWHAHHFELIDSQLDDMARAAFWYSTYGLLKNVKINTIKSLRNAEHIRIEDSIIIASEVGWFCNDMQIENTYIEGDYPLLKAKNITINKSHIDGKYSLQYMKNVRITDSILDTKDAFWHSENVIVENSKVNGAYLGWYGKNLTFINCEIIGTQPLCYTEGVKLKNCTMKNADLAFEYSDVEADIIGHIDSVKNPKSGYIKADTIGEIILSQSIMLTDAVIETKPNK